MDCSRCNTSILLPVNLKPFCAIEQFFKKHKNRYMKILGDLIVEEDLVYKPRNLKTIIVVGSSQNGKSALCNFLITGRPVDYKTAPFKMGNGVSACTVEPKIEQVKWSYKKFTEREKSDGILADTYGKAWKLAANLFSSKKEPEIPYAVAEGIVEIMDTPGVGDTRGYDEENMCRLYKTLTELDLKGHQLSCVLLVIKFPSLFDEKYKQNLRFYQKMFSQLFKMNVVLVVTGYSQEEKQIRKQENSGNPPGEVLAAIQKQCRDELQLEYDIPICTIETFADENDCMDWHMAQDTRNIILNRCFEIPGASLRTATFPKPPSMLAKDKAKVGELIARREGITVGLQTVKSALADVSRFMNDIYAQKEKLQRDISEVTRLLSEKDNEEIITIAERSYSAALTPFWWSSMKFDISVDYDISAIYCTNGTTELAGSTNRRVQGTVFSSWFSGLSATITVGCRNSVRWAQEIEDNKLKLEQLNRLYEEKTLEVVKFFSTSVHKQAEESGLSEEYARICEEISSLSQVELTLQEMISRINFTS